MTSKINQPHQGTQHPTEAEHFARNAHTGGRNQNKKTTSLDSSNQEKNNSNQDQTVVNNLNKQNETMQNETPRQWKKSTPSRVVSRKDRKPPTNRSNSVKTQRRGSKSLFSWPPQKRRSDNNPNNGRWWGRDRGRDSLVTCTAWVERREAARSVQ